MPDTVPRWPRLLREMECEQSGDPLDFPPAPPPASAEPYRSGWSACMQWLARMPPNDIDPEARELWFNGFDDAMDAPLGSAPTDEDLMRAGVWL